MDSEHSDTLTDIDELDRFEDAVGAFLRGEMDPERFVGVRLQQGVYGQRQEGVHMVRIKLPGGRLTPVKLTAIAEAVERFTEHQIGHISTRQDIQLHYVPTEQTPALLRHLADAGITTREACGNTVRNITTCPLAGVCPREHVDVTAHLRGAVKRFLRHPLTQHLPRKFKISFSGCEADCAQGMMHDLGVVAMRRADGAYGFKVMAGGGLGHKPHEAIVIEPFLSERDLLPCMEAVIALHHKYSDRKRRAKARIKFLVDRFGADGFLEKYREEYGRIRSAYANQPYPQGDWTGGTPGNACGAGAPRAVFAQKQPGYFVFPIALTIGDITPAQMRGIAALMQREGLEDIRTTQDQNLMILHVPERSIASLRAGLKALDLGEPRVGDDVVACPGTSTCKLGITSSKIIARMFDGGPLDLRVRVSGCHNSCAQPDTGDIGLYGEGRRMFGRLIPHYVFQLGGNGMAGGALAMEGPEIPSARAPDAVRRIENDYRAKRAPDDTFFTWSRRQGVKYFEDLLADLAQVTEADVPSLLSDHGQQGAFRVLQLGGGECAGANQEQVAALYYEAAYERSCRNAFLYERKLAEALQCIVATVRLVGQALLRVTGAQAPEPELAALPALIKAAQPDHPAVADAIGEIVRDIDLLTHAPDADRLQALAERVDEWMRATAEICQARDPLLDLSASIPQAAAPRPVAARVVSRPKSEDARLAR